MAQLGPGRPRKDEEWKPWDPIPGLRDYLKASPERAAGLYEAGLQEDGLSREEAQGYSPIPGLELPKD